MEIVFATFASKSLFIVRVVLGVIFFAHGAQKVFGWFGGPGLRGVMAVAIAQVHWRHGFFSAPV